MSSYRGRGNMNRGNNSSQGNNGGRGGYNSGQGNNGERGGYNSGGRGGYNSGQGNNGERGGYSSGQGNNGERGGYNSGQGNNGERGGYNSGQGNNGERGGYISGGRGGYNSGGRGGREWNPMSDAYHDSNFNSYKDSPGAGFRPSNRQDQGQRHKLYVSNIALGLTQDGLTNLLCDIGEMPKSVDIKNPKPGSYTTYGFIEYAESGPAMNAITKLNGKPPHNLRVQFSIEKGQGDNVGHQADFSNQYGHRSNFHERQPVRAPEQSDGSHRDLDHSVNARVDTALGSINIQAGSDGRKVCMGRGYHPARANGESPHPSPLKLDQGAGHVDHHVSNVQQSEGAKGGSPVQKCNIQEDDLKCTGCLKQAFVMCSLCKLTPYCSLKCSVDHWPAHGFTCVKIIPHPGVSDIEKVLEKKPPVSQQFNDAPVNDVMNHSATNNNGASAIVSSPPSLLKLQIPIVPNTTENMNNRFSPRPKENQSRASVPRSPPQVSAMTAVPEQVAPQPRTWMTSEVLPDGRFSKVTVKTSLPTEFWVQLQDNEEKVNKLTKGLNSNPARLTVLASAPKVGDLYAATYQHQWYRVKLTVVKPNGEFYVQYIDYGNTEVTTSRDIRSIPSEFCEIPAQAIKISLPGGNPDRNSKYPTETFMSVKPVKMLGDGSILVDIMEQGSSQLRPVQEVKAIAVHDVSNYPCKKSAELPFGTITKVEIVDQSPKGYWVILYDNVKDLDALNVKIEHGAASFPAMPAAGHGHIVAAQFEGNWYRAEVTSAMPLKVKFIDFGNEVEVQPSEIKSLPKEFATLPAQAIHIAIKGNATAMQGLASESVISVKMVGPAVGGVIPVQLEEASVPKVPAVPQNNQSPAGPSRQQALANESREQFNAPAVQPAVSSPLPPIPGPAAASQVELPSDQFTKLTVTVAGVGMFWANITENAEKHVELLGPILKNSFEACPNPEVGDFVCVLYEDLWYRARVLKRGPIMTSVHLIDFGNYVESKLEEIRLLPIEFTTFKGEAIHIQCPESPNHSYEECVEVFARPIEKTADGTVVAVVRAIAQLPDMEFTKVQAQYSLGLDIWVQLADNITFQQLMLKLNSNLALTACQPEVGDLVLVIYAELWSRALVLCLNPIKVMFIDYGNEEDVPNPNESLRAIPEEFVKIPDQAIKIRLIDNTLSESEMKTLTEFGSEFFVKPGIKGPQGSTMVEMRRTP